MASKPVLNYGPNGQFGVSIVYPQVPWGFKRPDDIDAKKDPIKDGTWDVEPLENVTMLREIYDKASPGYSARVTVPVLWDRKLGKIVNNESSEIIRMLHAEFDEFATNKELDLYPKDLRGEIDALNEWVYNDINNGVYKAGFSKDQDGYEAAVYPLFEAMDRIEGILANNGGDYLVGGRLTEADVRLYVTMIRFDPAYYSTFRCNLKDIRHDYPHIHKWLRQLYWKNDAFKSTTNFEHLKVGYNRHGHVNPHGIVPAGPRQHILPL
ncbi:glutathione S-transferase [Atractiella rhizophila]|nr:glutathione S-transferase [Atractiella rhizophila]